MPTNDRFFRPGITRVYGVPTVAALAAMTVAEVTAGAALHPDLADWEGFTYAAAFINAPDWNDNFVGKEPGEDQSADSAFVFYERKVTNTPKTTLAKGTSIYVAIFFAGLAGATPAAGDKYDLWPVKSAGPSRQYSRTDLARYRIPLGPTARPTLDGVVAA